MLSERLRESTHIAHQAAEKKMIVALKRIETFEDYIRMLNWLYGFYAPIEGLVKEQLSDKNIPDMEKRFRAEYLQWDIRDSGLPAPPQDTCDELPVINSIERALGALYVLEGSTLGGRIIAGMISRQLETNGSQTYFNGYGAETGHMWQSFKEILDQPRSEAQQEEIINAASHTFLT